MNKKIKYSLLLALICCLCLTLLWFHSPATVGAWFLSSSPVNNLTIGNCAVLSNDELLLSNLRYREIGLGTFEAKELKISLLSWPLFFGESPINEIVISKGGSFETLAGESKSSESAPLVGLPFRRLSIETPGITFCSAPKLVVTSAEMKPNTKGYISVAGALETLGGRGLFSGAFNPTMRQGSFAIEAKGLPCSALSSMVTTCPISGSLTLKSQVIIEERKGIWRFIPKGVASVSDLKVASLVDGGSFNLVGSEEQLEVTSFSTQLDIPHYKKIETKGSLKIVGKRADLCCKSDFFDLNVALTQDTSSPIQFLLRLLEKEFSYEIKGNLKNLPLSPIKDIENYAKIRDGKISGNFRCAGRFDKKPEVSGSLQINDLSLQSSVAGLSSISMSLVTTKEQVRAEVLKGALLVCGMPRMELRTTAICNEKGLDISCLSVQGKGGFEGRGKVTFRGLPPYSSNSLKQLNLEMNKLPIGPKLLLAPKLLGNPMAGLVSLNLKLEHPTNSSIVDSDVLCQLTFESCADSILPIRLGLTVQQNREHGSFALELKDIKSDSSLALNGSQSQASLSITSFPLKLLKLPIDKVSLRSNFSWPSHVGNYPLARLYNDPPNKFSTEVLSGMAIGTDGRELLKVTKASSIELWPKEKKGKGQLALSLLGQELIVLFNEEGNGDLALKCEKLLLPNLWKEIYPTDFFFKPLGSLTFDVTGPSTLNGKIKLSDGGIEHWQKSEGLIRCLTVNLPILDFLLGGSIKNPSMKSEPLSCSLTGGRVSMQVKKLPVTWEERAPLAQKILRKGMLLFDGDVNLGGGHLTLGGWSERRKKDDTFSRLSIKGDVERKSPKDESLALDVVDETGGGKGLFITQTKNSRLYTKLSSSALSLGHIPGYASLDEVTLDLDGEANMHFPKGLFHQLDVIRQNGADELLKLLRRDGQLTINKMAIRGTSLEVAIKKPFSAKFSGTGVTLNSFEASLANQTIKASGSFDPYGACSLTLDTDKVPLAGLFSLVGLSNLSVDGSLTAQLALTGKMPFPDLEGSLSLNGGKLRFPYFSESLVLDSLNLISKGPTTILSATGLKWGDTPLQFIGRQEGGTTTVELSGKKLTCSLGQTRIPAIDVQATALVPQTGVPKITVELKGNQGTNVHLPSSIPSTESTTDQQLERALSLFSSVDGRVSIELPPRLRLVNQFIDAEVRGSGSIESRPQINLTVKLQLVGGEVSLHRRSFKLQQGSLTIAGHPKELRTALSLKAKTSVGDYTVELSVSGSIDEPQVALSSIPALSEENIIALLTMGMVPLSSSTSARDEVAATAKDYLVTSALSDYLLANLKIRDITLRSSTEGSFVRMRKYVGKRLRVDVEQALQQQDQASKGPSLSFELGLDNNLFLEGRKSSGEDDKTNDSYLGLLRTFRFR